VLMKLPNWSSDFWHALDSVGTARP
jgi:hypothetical protein